MVTEIEVFLVMHLSHTRNRVIGRRITEKMYIMLYSYVENGTSGRFTLIHYSLTLDKSQIHNVKCV